MPTLPVHLVATPVLERLAGPGERSGVVVHAPVVADNLKTLHNRFKNAQGQLAGFRRGSIVEKQRERDEAVLRWAAARPQYKDAAEAYPIASFSYVMIYKDLAYTKDEAKAKALVDFWKWALTDGQKMAGALDYAPVGDEVSKKVTETLDSLTYSGKPVK